MNPGHRMTDPKRIVSFMLAGKSTTTIVSKETGTRFTYRIRISDDGKAHFVDLMNGPDNESSFLFIGTIAEGHFRWSRRSRVAENHKAVVAFGWVWRWILREVVPEQLEVWHEGRCGRCNRKLTVPESIETGLGPTCAGF